MGFIHTFWFYTKIKMIRHELTLLDDNSKTKVKNAHFVTLSLYKYLVYKSTIASYTLIKRIRAQTDGQA